MKFEKLDDSKIEIGARDSHHSEVQWYSTTPWGIPVFRYDRNWWHLGLSPCSFYTTSLAQCEFMEHTYLNSTTPVGQAKWCPFNWGDYYPLPRDNNLTYRRPVFWIVDVRHRIRNGDDDISEFRALRKGIEYTNRQYFAFGCKEFQKYLQLNLWNTNSDGTPMADGDYEYHGIFGRAYSSRNADGSTPWIDANGHYILAPLHLAIHKSGYTNVYTTDSGEYGKLPSQTWTKIDAAFYVHPWTYDGTSVYSHEGDQTGTTYHVPYPEEYH